MTGSAPSKTALKVASSCLTVVTCCMSQLTLYKSSAGSGKTFTLVNEYLKLVLPEPATFRSVLAVTFTHKATEEMKSRIIAILSKLSNSSIAELAQLTEYQLLRAHFDAIGRSDLDLQVQARATLNRILNDYSSFSVSTIESFFQRIVRAFARELSIPLGYEVEMEQDLVLDQLVDDLFLQLGNDPLLTKLLEGFVRRNLEQERSWNIDQEVKALGREIFKERYQQQELQHPAPEDRIEETLALADEVWAIRRQFEAHMTRSAQQALALITERGLAISDFAYGKSGVAHYFQNVLDGTYAPGKRAREAYQVPEKWYTKSSKRKADIEAALQAGLMDLLGDLLDTYDQDFTRYNTALQVSRTIYSFGLLSDLTERLEDYRRERSLLLISDTSFLLNRVIKGQFPAPFVYEKIGVRFRHYLLDEFQDTSDLQWLNLLPLVLEGLSQGAASLIVGDVKQSIYRWRSGNLRLLAREVEEQAQVLNQSTRVEALTSNWRTAADIVRFNNRCFEAAVELLRQKFPDDREQLFETAYQSVAQHPQKNRYPGYVCLSFFPDPSRQEPDAPSWKELALAQTLATIQQLKADGFRGSDITLLMRTNRDGVEVAQYLQRHEVSVVSAESLLIVSDPKVRLLQALLQHLNHEEDPITQASLAYAYARVVHGRGSEHETFARQAIAGFSDELAVRKPALRQLPVYECVEQLLHLLPEQMRHPNAYVQGFMDCVLTYSSTQDASIAGFLAWWGEQQHKRAIAAAPDPDAVQIMTMHQAKGLEFPVVILPFAEWELTPKSKGVLWVEPQAEPYRRFPYLPVMTSSKLLETDFASAYTAETLEAHLDNLNLLYVAFTRPEYRLYVFTKQVKDPEKLRDPEAVKSISSLLNALACNDELGGTFTEAGQHYVCGQPISRAELTRLGAKAHDESEASQPLRPNLHTSTAWNEKIRVRFQASQFLRADLVEQRGRIDEGELIHSALAHVATPADVDRALAQLTTQGLLTRREEARLRRRLQQAMALPAAAAWFDGSWQVRNEADIIQADGSVLRPDRVMLRGQHAVVVDYKTGQPFARHHQQVQQYMAALRDLGYDPVQGYVYYLGQERVEEVSE